MPALRFSLNSLELSHYHFIIYPEVKDGEVIVGLFNLVLEGRLKQPTQVGFNLAKWQSEYSKFEAASSRDVDLIKLVLLFNKNFSKLRSHLKEHPFPFFSRDENLKVLVAFLNREFMVLQDHGTKAGKLDDNTFSINKVIEARIDTVNGNSVDADGYFSGLIESTRYIYNELICSKYHSITYKSDFSILNFLIIKLNLAGAYNLNEDLWQKSFWLNWGVEVENESFQIVPRDNRNFDRQVVGIHRFLALNLETSQRVYHAWSKFSDNWKKELSKNCLGSVRIRNGVYVIVNEVSKKNELRDCIVSSVVAEEVYWNELLIEQLPSLKDICIRDILSIWSSLASYAELLEAKIPRDTEVMTLSKLKQFSVEVNKKNLIAKLKKKHDMNASKVRRILALFTCDGDVRVDPWFTPLIDLRSDSYLFVIGVLRCGNIIRLIEYLLKKGGISLSRRGRLYEDYSYNQIKEEIESIPYLKSCKTFSSRKIFVNDDDFEEIDFIWMIKDTMLVLEMKCSLFPTGGIGYHNYLEDLREGARQVKRKRKFILENKQKVFEYLGIECPRELHVEVAVMSNLPLGSGFPLEEVPIIDNYLLGTFIRGRHRLFAHTKGRGPFQGGKVKVYHTSLDEADSNLGDYLSGPTSTELLRTSLKYRQNPFTGLFSGDVKAFYLSGEVSPNLDFFMKSADLT